MSTNKRIAIVYNSAWYLYHFRSPLVRALQERGYEIHAITPLDDSVEKLKSLGVMHHELPMHSHGLNPLQEMFTIVRLYSLLRTVGPKLTISYTIKCNIYAGLIRYLLGFKHISNIVGLGRAFEKKNLLSWLARSLYRLSIYHADQTFFQNEEDREAFVAQGIVQLSNTTVTPGSGVDLTLFDRAQSSPSSAKRIFFMFGRLIPAKGFLAFTRSIAKLRESYPELIEGWIAGGLDGSQSDSRNLKEVLEQSHKNGEICYFGHCDNIKEKILACDVVVLPSTYNEGVPRSLLEALACGKPVITTDWKGCRETVIQDKNGVTVPPFDEYALTNAIERFALMERSELTRFGQASRDYAEKRFDQKLVLALYLNSIDTLLTESRQ